MINFSFIVKLILRLHHEILLIRRLAIERWHEILIVLLCRLRHEQVLILLLLYGLLLIIQVLRRLLHELLTHHSRLRSKVTSMRWWRCHCHSGIWHALSLHLSLIICSTWWSCYEWLLLLGKHLSNIRLETVWILNFNIGSNYRVLLNWSLLFHNT